MRTAALVLALAACGSKKSADDAKPCAQRAADFGAWVQSIRAEGDSGHAGAPGPLVEADDAPLATPEPATLVAITRDAITVQGVPAASPEELRERLAEAGDLGGAPGRVDVSIAPDVPMDRVAGVAAALVASRFTNAGFAFARKSAYSPPPPSAVTAKIDAIRAEDPSRRATDIARIMVTTVGGCKSVGALFSQVGAVDVPKSKSEFIADGIGSALAACDCKIDLDDFRNEMWALMSTSHPIGMIDVTLAPAEDGAAVQVTGGTWADASSRLRDARGKRVRLVPPTLAH